MHRFVWIDPNFFDLYPNSIQTGGVVQFCPFQNMYDMLWAKVDRLAGKIYFVQKNRKRPKTMDDFSDMLTLQGAGGQTDDTGLTFRVPLKTLGYNGSNQLCGRLVASKFRAQEPVTLCLGTDKEISEKRNFFENRSVPEDFQ